MQFILLGRSRNGGWPIMRSVEAEDFQEAISAAHAILDEHSGCDRVEIRQDNRSLLTVDRNR